MWCSLSNRFCTPVVTIATGFISLQDRTLFAIVFNPCSIMFSETFLFLVDVAAAVRESRSITLLPSELVFVRRFKPQNSRLRRSSAFYTAYTLNSLSSVFTPTTAYVADSVPRPLVKIPVGCLPSTMNPNGTLEAKTATLISQIGSSPLFSELFFLCEALLSTTI